MTFTHVALVGLMGSGKSAVGEVIARRLGVPMVDVDDEITARTGRSVREIWEEGGADAHRSFEREVVLDALAPGPGRVLAAPGGVAVDPVAADALSQPHIAVVYLRVPPEVLAERVRADDQPRPLLGVDPEGVLTEMHAARDARYAELADRIEPADGLSPEQIAARILDAFGDSLARPGAADA